MRSPDETCEVSRFNALRAVLRLSFRQSSVRPSASPPVRQSPARQLVSRQFANPPTHISLFFSNVCMRVSVSAFHGVCRWSGVVLYGAPGLSKYTLNGVTGNGISWGGLRLVQSVLLRRSGCIDTENADTSSEPRTQTVQRVARTCVLLELKSIKSIKIRVEFGCDVGVSG
jgi:hypothetical protein